VKPWLPALGICAALLVTSLGVAQEQKAAAKREWRSSTSYSELLKAPERARARRNPLEDDPEAVAAGKILFEDHCQECHGSSGQNGRHGPNLRVPAVQNASPGTLFWLLSGGVVRKGMPVWSKLPEAQRWQIVRYIKSLGIDEMPTLSGNPAVPQCVAENR
jgi:mono/diheme cytochrome c family protein